MISYTKIKKDLHRSVAPTLMNMALAGTAVGSSTTGSYYSKCNRNAPNGKTLESRDSDLLNSVSQMHTLNRAQRRKAQRIQQSIKTSDLSIHANKQVSELFIIDGAVHDKEVLIDAANRPGAEVLVLQNGGVVEMVNALDAYSGLKAIHVLSHAKTGELLIGNERITKSRLDADPFILDALNGAMAEGADLLLYGCELADSQEGEELLEIISQGADVDVAASNDLTGNEEYNGDWDLEIATGDIEAEILADSTALKDFTEVLQTIVPQSDGSYNYTPSNSTSMAGGFTVILTAIGGTGLYNPGPYVGSSVYTIYPISTHGFAIGTTGSTTTRITIVDGSGQPATFDLTSGVFAAGWGQLYGVSATVTGNSAGSGTIPNLTTRVDQTVNFSGLVNNTSVDIVTSGSSFLQFSSLTFANVTAAGAADNTPPVFESSTPSTSAITTSGVTLATDIDEEGTIYYAVLADNAPVPSSADIVAGTGNAAAAISSGSQAVTTGSFSHNFNITGLNPGTPYDIYIVAQDDETTPNLQATPELREITTTCALAASISAHTDLSCNGDNSGSVTVSASNGAANYDYNWSGATNTLGSSSASNTITGLAAGTYDVTVTDGTGCTATASETLTEPAPLSGGTISF